ncbi:MAG: glycosyltransferase, partial [Nitrospiraceae bacterium]|nr:glycosyltransferase [Nitrospiraceae bacterium]
IDLKCTRVRYALPKIIMLSRRKPDVIFSALGNLNLALSIIRPLLAGGVRYVGRETSIVSNKLSNERHRRLRTWAYRHCYSRFDAVVCQSRYLLDDLAVNFSLDREKAVIIYNPVDIERINRLASEGIPDDPEPARPAPERAIRLVAAGRLTYAKGFDLLIESLALCGDPRLKLTLLGDGGLRGQLENLAREKGLAERVRFAGFRKNPYPFFARADAFVLSSRYEALPNVVLEALACGTPVIANPAAGGTREILEAIPGCELAESVSAPALAAAIRRWLVRKPGRLSADAVSPYAVREIAGKYEELILRVASFAVNS